VWFVLVLVVLVVLLGGQVEAEAEVVSVGRIILQ
tara:strand:- start:737 stop:838 length:102 start_codon:yes stop_codon:yes gene_type:complete